MKKFAKIMAVALVVVLALAALVACAPNSNPDKALESLKKNDYKNAAKDTLVVPLALTALGVKGVDTVISASKSVKDGDSTKFEKVTIVYFTDAKSAQAAWDKVEKYADDQKGDSKDWTVAQTGAMIYWGTSAAIKAAR